MNFSPIKKRPLNKVGSKIWQAIALMEHEFGGVLTHDSNHDPEKHEEATTWIFTFPSFGNSQIAVPMNQNKLSLLMRGTTVGGLDFGPLLEGVAEVEKTYVNEKKGVASSILGSRAPYLNPSIKNPIFRVKPLEGCVDEVLSRYFSKKTHQATVIAAVAANNVAALQSRRYTLSEDELREQLERQSETGKAGEFFVVQKEIERLRQLSCPEPEKYVRRVSVTDVGRGFDIETTWPGQERCIEVKTTTKAGSDFFLTSNERSVLTELGDKAWLYRVQLCENGNHIFAALQNPLKSIGEDSLTPVVWRVKGDALGVE